MEYLGNVWRMSEGCLGNVRKVSGICLEAFKKVSGRCLEDVWWVSGGTKTGQVQMIFTIPNVLNLHFPTYFFLSKIFVDPIFLRSKLYASF